MNVLAVAVWEKVEGVDEKTVWVAVLKAAKDPSSLVRARAFGAMSAFPKLTDETIPLLIAALRDHELERDRGDTVSAVAARTLHFLGAKAKPAFDALIEATTSPHPRLVWDATTTISELVKKTDPKLSEAAVAAFWKVARDKTRPTIRSTGMYGILALVEIAPPKVNDIIEILREQEAPETLCTATLDVLSKLGPDATEALPTLLKRLRDRTASANEKERVIAVLQALKKAAVAKEIAVLQECLDAEKDPHVRDLLQSLLMSLK